MNSSTASSIKIAILAEFYHQAQQGKLKFTDPYTLRGQTSSAAAHRRSAHSRVTRLTLRDVAALMIP